MISPTLANPGTLEREDDFELLQKNGKKEELDRRLFAISRQVKAYARYTFDELGAASAKETTDLLAGLDYVASLTDEKKLEEEIIQWEKYVNGQMQMQMDSARDLYNNLMEPLSDAVRERVISERVMKELQDKFRDRNLDYKTKEKYILKKLPGYIKKWKAVREQYNSLKKNPEVHKLSATDVPDIKDFLDEERFLNLKYPKRKDLLAQIKAALLARKEKKEAIYKKVENTLIAATKQPDQCLDPSSIGKWLLKAMKHPSPETYLEEVLLPLIARWRSMRKRFDRVNAKIDARQNELRGFVRLTPAQFWSRKPKERIAYLEEAESRLESNVNDDGPLNTLILDIRHCLDTEDWEQAAELLKKAKTMDPKNKEIRSMENYLQTHAIFDDEATSTVDNVLKASELNKEIQHIVQLLPGSMQSLTEDALYDANPNMLIRIWQGFYNRVWVIEHNYSTPELDQIHAESEVNRERTAEHIRNGHEAKLAHEIMDGETANDAGINDAPVKAQVLHVGLAGRGEIREAYRRNANNAKFGYWTTLHLKDVPYELHRLAVKNYMYILKRNARELRKLGFSYSRVGAPIPLN
ncbi:MAG TPA: hypothetical protein VHA78_04180 [Candidatus Peribacteraceae bacterium]|nr:hypothetical protein [Candidatus Peribacteraceae bacterium]